jgi:HSP20 family protein
MSTELQKHETQAPAKGESTYRRPYYTVQGNKETYSVEVYMPGVAKDDYNVSLKRDELLVEGHKVLPIPSDAKWVHREITPESYQLRLQLNVDVDPEGITAKSEDGILLITLPVAKESRPRTIKIN